MEYEWIIWLLGSLCVLFTLGGGLMCLSDDRDTKEQGLKLLVGWWSGVAIITIATLTMHFVVKPILGWLLGLF